MTPDQTAALLGLVATLDRRIQRAMADAHQAARTIGEWNEATVHIPAVTEDGTWDAAHCVRRYYEQHRGDHTARYFEYQPHHLLAAWAEYRQARMQRHTDPLPTADPDDVTAYQAELRAARQAVATGQAAPHEYRAELDPVGRQRLAVLAGSVGGRPGAADDSAPYVTPELRAELRGHVPDSRATQPALAVPCPVATCRAGVRHPCTSPVGRELRRAVHGQRRDAWAVRNIACPDCGAPSGQTCSATEPHPVRIRAALAAHEGHRAA